LLTVVGDGSEWSASRPGLFTPGEDSLPDNASIDVAHKRNTCRESNPDSSAAQLAYWLRCGRALGNILVIVWKHLGNPRKKNLSG
jgi:hypothetical protein